MYVVKLLFDKFPIKEPEVSSSRSIRYAIKVDKKWKWKLRISNVYIKDNSSPKWPILCRVGR